MTTDILKDWLRDLPMQFLGKKNIEVLIKAFARQMQELDTVFDELNSKTDLDTAMGQNLDYVGTIIPLTRKEAGELAGLNVEEPVISDERYRQFLRYKLLVNTNECTYYDLMDGLALLWDVSPIYYIEDPDMPATIILTMPFLKPGGEVVTLGEVPMVKAAGVRIEFEYRIKVVVETLVRWIYSVYNVPLTNQLVCGTHPRWGSLGRIYLLQTEIGIKEIQRVFELKKTGTIRVGGKLYDSTIGEVITEDVQIEINSSYEVQNVILAGQIVCGTHPHQAVNGVFIGADAVVGGNVTSASAFVPLSGTVPGQSTESVMIGSCIEAGKTISNVADDVPLSGTMITGGQKPGKSLIVSAGVSSKEPSVRIAAADAKKCGTGGEEMLVISSGISSSPSVSIAAADAKKCGAKEETVLSISAGVSGEKPSVYITAATSRRCGTGVCGK